MLDLAAVLVSLAFLLIVIAVLLRRRGAPARSVSLEMVIESARSIGHLSVFRISAKEIVSQYSHDWGEFGRKYLRWLWSEKKMILVFEVDLDFLYDLRDERFQIVSQGPGAYLIRLPPGKVETRITDIKVYDEQGSRFLPMVLPELLNRLGGFSPQEKNRLIDEAKGFAARQARELMDRHEALIRNSAEGILRFIVASLGATSVAFEYDREKPEVDVSIREGVAVA